MAAAEERRAAGGGNVLIGEILSVALGALRANKMRSFLTMLGIVIGVAAVIAMIALGRGAQQAVRDRISALGTTLLTIMPGQQFGRGVVVMDSRARLTMEDAEAVAERATLLTAVQPEMNRQLQVQYVNKNTNTQIIGTTANYLDVRKYRLAAGRMFTNSEDDGRKRVAVLGPTVVENLGLESAEALIGEPIRIRGIQFEVVGVLDRKGTGSGFQDPDDLVLIPLQTARFRVMGSNWLRSINVLAQSEAQIPNAMAEIQKILRREHRLRPGREDDFQIRNQSDFLSTFEETTKVFGVLLLGIATVSLLVGGIGIMNIMLVSVTERTREIGVRKALGATRINILLQFLIEAVVLCLLGGLIGVILGVGSATVLRESMDWNTDVSMLSVGLAFLFAAAVGIVFGVWPARRAARLDPILALRYE
ncbi:MAG TPA: ABC transporter permease [Gemmatimonadaceae bacterium]|nr:ABC transporter permease [Gemmatimonadaceae bacterium]